VGLQIRKRSTLSFDATEFTSSAFMARGYKGKIEYL